MATDEPASEHALRASRTYGAAADHYRRPALGFWDRSGAATVSRLRLAPGAAVLDLCCGAGASALPAARAVGPSGSVLGIDIAAPMLELVRAHRATVDALSPEQRDRVRDSVLAELRSREITLLRTDVLFGTAARPG